MRILITGGSGLLGQVLELKLKEHDYDVYSTFNKNPLPQNKKFKLDITNKNNVDHILKMSSPDVIVHTAAYTNVDKCEKNKDIAYAINVKGTENIVEFGRQTNTKLIYISTDYVFDGKKGLYGETDSANPINYYGFTKFQGEELVVKKLNDFIIARASVIFGVNKRNFVTWLIDQLNIGREINIVNNQYVSPTLNIDLVEQIIELIENNQIGIFHTAGAERISRYDFAIAVADAFDLDTNLVKPIKMDKMDWLAQRPKDSSLDVSKISDFKKPYRVKKSLHIFKNHLWG